ncbi:TonB-dependent receptor [Xanthomonas campestris pv. trichodesmae]|uniref:Oar protein n=2 Tax=Xanthomonas citri TaxID=346 RepID=A0AB33CC81_XANCI|nr:TonB-dependent receptor [Xanthomonas citri]ASK91772.1 Oar protein [Xanthomonas citri pv. vignicola]MBV6780028.1 TonB-dependent receptor [Xanthomonas campestris pv. trichodesmae]MBZ3918269.1 Oar protein [Xanthomonas campestris pv. trichodesmae]MBZ3922645.1 Oar protein [Xanthomonas citri pv. sesbaniae]
MTHPRYLRMSKLTLGLVAALAAAPVFAQSTSAGVAGLVTGSGGQPVPNAEVTITHVESGTVSRATTDASGRYNARGLRVGGPYTITIIASGAGNTTREGVYLNLDKVNQVDAALGGDLATLGTVQAIAGNYGSAIFSANKMGTGTNVTREEIESLPSINRNLQDYVRLDPRVAQTDKARNEISIAGQNPRYNAIRVDGISTNDAFGLESNSLPTPRQPFSMDVIDEISVDVANYDVTITGGTGGVINAVTKSGTNEFHGSVYGTYRDNDWSGKNQNGIRPQLFDNEKTYGLTFGGPIVKDKLFFFANYEKYDGKGVFTGASGYGPQGSGASNIVNVSQAQVDDIINISRNVYGFDPGTLTLPALDSESEEKGIKIDWNISDKHRASFRYGKSEQETANLNGFSNTSLALNSYHYVRNFNLETYTAQLFSDWNEKFSTEAKVSYRDYSAVRDAASRLPAVGVRVGNNFVNLGTEQSTQANELQTKTWNAFFAANLYLNDHTVKFGADYEDNDIFNLFAQRVFGSYTFNSIDDYRNNRPANYRYSQSNSGNIDDIAAKWGMKNVGLFLQDTWSVNSNLTLTFGVRYDEPLVKNSPQYNAAASATFGVRNDQTIDGNGLLQPRFGFNYTFDADRPTQLRGGVGLFQGAAASVWLSNPYSNTGLAYTDYNFSSVALVNQNNIRFTPDVDNQPRGNGTVSGATQSVDFVDKDLGQPSVWKANLAFDTELPWYGVVASIEGVVTKVKEAIYYQQLNLADARGPSAIGQDGRLIYWNQAGLNPANWNVNGAQPTGASVDARGNRYRSYNDAIIARPTNKGGSQSLTVGLNKPFNESDWSWSLAYTFANADEVSGLTSSTSSSQLGNTAVFQANEEVNATSAYEVRNSFLGTLQWKHNFFGDYATKVGLVYQGRSGRPYSYTFDNDANGDGRLNDLLYIPKGPGDVRFGSAAEEAAFWNFVNSDQYLSTHKGQVAQRNAARNTWVNQFDLHIEQELPGFVDGNKAQIWLDVMNVGNLLNKKWGRVEEYAFPGMRGVVEYGGIDASTGKYVYRFNQPDAATIYDDKGISRWALQLGFRYQF